MFTSRIESLYNYSSIRVVREVLKLCHIPVNLTSKGPTHGAVSYSLHAPQVPARRGWGGPGAGPGGLQLRRWFRRGERQLDGGGGRPVLEHSLRTHPHRQHRAAERADRFLG